MSPPETVQRLIDYVCATTRVTRAQIMSGIRPRYVTVPRQIIYWLIQTECQWPVNAIAKVMGRDHGSICKGIANVRNRMETEPRFRAYVAEVRGGWKA